MYRIVLCLLLVTHVILGAEEKNLGLDQEWTITDENLEKTVNEVPNFIVFVYVDWCGHCKSFAPTWKKIAENLNNSPDSKTKVFSANVEKNKQIHNSKGVTSFPTIFFVRKGEWKQYASMRTEENVLEFVKKHEEDATIVINPDELEEFLSVSDVSVVGKFSSGKEVEDFDKLAWEMELPAAAILLDNTQLDGITVHSNLEGKPYRVTHRDLTDWEGVKEFTARARRPLVIPFNIDNHKMVFQLKSISTSVLLFHDKDDGYEQRLKIMGKASRTYREKCNFVEMEMSNEYVMRFADFFKIKAEELPIVHILDTDKEKNTKGQMSSTKDLSEKGIAQLIEDYMVGESEMSTPAQPGQAQEGEDKLPEDWETRPVKYLTSTNYPDYVLNPDKDVFVMIYRDSCPHCETFKPTWEELAKKHETHETVKIAHMKSQHVKNVTGLEVKKVPTLLFYPRGVPDVTQGLEYEKEGRSLEDLENYLKEAVFTDEDSKKDEL